MVPGVPIFYEVMRAFIRWAEQVLIYLRHNDLSLAVQRSKFV